MCDPQRHAIRARACALALLAALALAPVPAARAAGSVVGTGTPASCTESAFASALSGSESSGGGTITFSCGTQPHTIIFSAMKTVGANIVLEGGDLVTLSGGNATALFQVFANQSLTLSHITIARGYGQYGAIENFGQLTVANSTFSGNTATASGGAILNHGALLLTAATLSNNSAGHLGGGIYSDGGSTTIIGSTLSGNTAVDGGGAVAVAAGASATVGASQFSGNRTSATFAEGGALYSAGALSVADSTFTQNSSSRGGALFVAGGTTSVQRGAIRGNWAAYGGGVRQAGGDLTISDVPLVGNGYNASGLQITTGGGALSWGAGTATLTNLTISGNWASYGGGFDHESGTTTLRNVTISGNAAVGGGGFDQANGSITLVNVTVVGNAAQFFAAGMASRGGTLALTNTVVSRNLNPSNGQRFNCYKQPTSAGFSLSSDATCQLGPGRDGVDPRLSGLSNNGGPTETHMPLRGSPLVDAGTGASCPATDQRGVARPQGAACDIGAVEVAPSDLTVRYFIALLRR